MAIDQLYFEYLSSAIKLLREDQLKVDSPLQVGCLSYPDLLVTKEQIVSKFPHLAKSDFVVRNDVEKIRKWHGMPHLEEIIETSDFFKKLNCDSDYFDFSEIRGGEIITDLNMPIDEKYHGQYDLIVDTGTLEHCFNVGVAFNNMCKLSSVGGLILSAAPMTKINHGFWNFSPCAYENYFSQNKFKILFLGAFYKEKGKIIKIQISANTRQICPAESALLCVARRLVSSTFNLPIQQKYL
jgi:hypothetical protein